MNKHEMYKNLVEKIKEKNWTTNIKDDKISKYKVPESIRGQSKKYIHYKNIRKKRLYRDLKYRDPNIYVLRVLAFTTTTNKEAEDITLEYLKKENFTREIQGIADDYYVPRKAELYDYFRRKREYTVRTQGKKMGTLTWEIAEMNKDSPILFIHPKTKLKYPHLGSYLRERDEEYPHETLMTTAEEERCHEFITKDYIELTK